MDEADALGDTGQCCLCRCPRRFPSPAHGWCCVQWQSLLKGASAPLGRPFTYASRLVCCWRVLLAPSPFVNVQLKNRLGAGYSLSLLTEPSRVRELEKFVKDNLPGADVLSGVKVEESAVVEGSAVASPQGASGSQQPRGPTKGACGTALPSCTQSTYLASHNSLCAADDTASGALTVSIPKARVGDIPRFLRLLQQHSKSSSDDNGKLISDWGLQHSSLEYVAVCRCATTACAFSLRFWLPSCSPSPEKCSCASPTKRPTPMPSHTSSRRLQLNSVCVLCAAKPRRSSSRSSPPCKSLCKPLTSFVRGARHGESLSLFLSVSVCTFCLPL